MPEETLLKVSHIDAFHGSFQALWDVSLSVKPGEIVAIIGANGSGKSTLLDTISGLVHPAKGSIEFEGKDISALEPFRDSWPWHLPSSRRKKDFPRPDRFRKSNNRFVQS